MLQMIFLVLTWLTGFLMLLTAVMTLFLRANGRRVLSLNVITIVMFLIAFGGLVLFT